MESQGQHQQHQGWNNDQAQPNRGRGRNFSTRGRGRARGRGNRNNPNADQSDQTHREQDFSNQSFNSFKNSSNSGNTNSDSTKQSTQNLPPNSKNTRKQPQDRVKLTDKTELTCMTISSKEVEPLIQDGNRNIAPFIKYFKPKDVNTVLQTENFSEITLNRELVNNIITNSKEFIQSYHNKEKDKVKANNIFNYLYIEYCLCTMQQVYKSLPDVQKYKLDRELKDFLDNFKFDIPISSAEAIQQIGSFKTQYGSVRIKNGLGFIYHLLCVVHFITKRINTEIAFDQIFNQKEKNIYNIPMTQVLREQIQSTTSYIWEQQVSKPTKVVQNLDSFNDQDWSDWLDDEEDDISNHVKSKTQKIVLADYSSFQSMSHVQKDNYAKIIELTHPEVMQGAKWIQTEDWNSLFADRWCIDNYGFYPVNISQMISEIATMLATHSQTLDREIEILYQVTKFIPTGNGTLAQLIQKKGEQSVTLPFFMQFQPIYFGYMFKFSQKVETFYAYDIQWSMQDKKHLLEQTIASSFDDTSLT